MEQAIEQHLIMGKGQQGAALDNVIQQVLKHPQIFVFAEFIDLCQGKNVSMALTCDGIGKTSSVGISAIVRIWQLSGVQKE